MIKNGAKASRDGLSLHLLAQPLHSMHSMQCIPAAVAYIEAFMSWHSSCWARKQIDKKEIEFLFDIQTLH